MIRFGKSGRFKQKAVFGGNIKLSNMQQSRMIYFDRKSE
jgi:hypothetical protein